MSLSSRSNYLKRSVPFFSVCKPSQNDFSFHPYFNLFPTCQTKTYTDLSHRAYLLVAPRRIPNLLSSGLPSLSTRTHTCDPTMLHHIHPFRLALSFPEPLSANTFMLNATVAVLSPFPKCQESRPLSRISRLFQTPCRSLSSKAQKTTKFGV